ncbi:MAG: hypothetical protein LBI38_00325 [Oscillospiraceae bacterium]|nr:hypothetical protein [Oscillospiraceae bacterium]
MKLTEWVRERREENEILDVFLQITRLLSDGKGQGAVSPALYEVDELNNVLFNGNETDLPNPASDFRAPENGRNGEKSDVFSLGMLLYLLLNKETYYQSRNVSPALLLKARRRSPGFSMIKSEDGRPVSLLMEKMTSVDADERPSLKDILAVLSGYVCRFSVLPQNIQTGEVFGEITRSFTGSQSYKFMPESRYVIDGVTLAPVSQTPLLIPFRLVRKQYALEVVYAKEGRWSYAVKKPDAPEVPPASEEAFSIVPKATAALYYCDAFYGARDSTLLCGTDGYSFELGYSEGGGKNVKISREGTLVAPERIGTRILSMLKQTGKAPGEISRVAVYGYGVFPAKGANAAKVMPAVTKTINDIFPEDVNICSLSGEDILRGAALYISDNGIVPGKASEYAEYDYGITVSDPVSQRYAFQTLIPAGTPVKGGVEVKTVFRPSASDIRNGICAVMLFRREKGFEHVNSTLEPDGDKIKLAKKIKVPLPSEITSPRPVELTLRMDETGGMDAEARAAFSGEE